MEGYNFIDEKLAAKAEVEAEGVRYLQEHTSFEDPNHVLKLYQQMIKEGMFVTPVGLAFLKEVRDFLIQSDVEETQIPQIPVKLSLWHSPAEAIGDSEEATKMEKRKEQAEVKKMSRTNRVLQKKYERVRFLCIVFALIIVGMFVITELSTNNVTILNYENSVVDKYEQWEQELEEREQALDEREKALED